MTMHRNAKRHAPRLEPLEERLCLACSVGWDGPGQGRAALTYYIGGAPSSLTQAAVQAALQTALDAWAAVADITFTQTSQPNRPDSIDFTFGTLDGPGGTLAEGYLPDDVNSSRIAGDIQFDAAEVWEVGNALGWSAMDLVYTAAHEIGHALGLDHSNVAGSLMAPTITPDAQFTGLAPTDVASILALYAPARLTTSTTPTDDTTTPLRRPTTPTTTPHRPRTDDADHADNPDRRHRRHDHTDNSDDDHTNDHRRRPTTTTQRHRPRQPPPTVHAPTDPDHDTTTPTTTPTAPTGETNSSHHFDESRRQSGQPERPKIQQGLKAPVVGHGSVDSGEWDV